MLWAAQRVDFFLHVEKNLHYLQKNYGYTIANKIKKVISIF